MDGQSHHYTVLARRYRPQTFSEVIGQQHAAQVLRNAIQKGRVAHAYLFTGARGVGKTSMARILAKALNCPHAAGGDPCNECDICLGVAAGHDVDVLEIDGASNRGIDDIRSLRANVNVKSMRTRYKIYIIDEVHMLTKEAFNALLKTLEEPPPNVKFVFCTTEPNKVPDTILSRCQRLDFATVETARIMERLAQIAETEGFEVEADALDLVARRAAGSMRDSQSLFDQLLAFGGERIGIEDVHRLLGTAPDDRLIGIVDALLSRDRAAALERFDAALGEGVQLGELTDQLISYFRDLLVFASEAKNVGLLSVAESNQEKLDEQAKQWGLQTIVAAMQILAEAKARMARTNSGRPLAELALVRISLLEELDQLSELIGQLKSGEIGGKAAAAQQPAGPARRSPAPMRPARATQSGSASKSGSANPPGPAAKKKSEPVAPEPDTPQPVAESENDELPVPIPFEAGREDELWTQILSHTLDRVRDHLKRASHIAIPGPNHLDISFPKRYTFSKQYCERPEEFNRLTQLVCRLTGQGIRTTLSVHEENEGDSSEVPSQAAGKPASRRRPLEPGDDSLVQQAVTVFGATIVKIEELSSPSPQEE